MQQVVLWGWRPKGPKDDIFHPRKFLQEVDRWRDFSKYPRKVEVERLASLKVAGIFSEKKTSWCCEKLHLFPNFVGESCGLAEIHGDINMQDHLNTEIHKGWGLDDHSKNCTVEERDLDSDSPKHWFIIQYLATQQVNEYDHFSYPDSNIHRWTSSTEPWSCCGKPCKESPPSLQNFSFSSVRNLKLRLIYLW